jgi:hypothetical protein
LLETGTRPARCQVKQVSYAILLFGLFAPITAQGFTGIDLYKICADPKEEGACLAYIRGFAEGYYIGIGFGQLAERQHRRPCYPHPPDSEPPDATQAELIVRKYMTDHPEKLDEAALLIMQQALGGAFSCRK